MSKLPNKKPTSLKEGFTLVELLVVIGILTILLAITIVAINPLRQFSQANNTQRRSDVLAILNAISEYMADNSGALPGLIGTYATGPSAGVVSLESDLATTGPGVGVDICSDLVPTYLAEMPVDPSASAFTDCTTTYDTGYTIYVSTGATSRVTVGAPSAELSETISVTR